MLYKEHTHATTNDKRQTTGMPYLLTEVRVHRRRLAGYLDGWPPGNTRRCEPMGPSFVGDVDLNLWPTVNIAVIVLTMTWLESNDGTWRATQWKVTRDRSAVSVTTQCTVWKNALLPRVRQSHRLSRVTLYISMCPMIHRQQCEDAHDIMHVMNIVIIIIIITDTLDEEWYKHLDTSLTGVNSLASLYTSVV